MHNMPQHEPVHSAPIVCAHCMGKSAIIRKAGLGTNEESRRALNAITTNSHAPPCMATDRLNDGDSMQAHTACPVEPVPPCEQLQCFDGKLRSIQIDEGSLLQGNLREACMMC